MTPRSRSTSPRLSTWVTWGTSPQDVVAIDGRIPDPAEEADEGKRAAIERSLAYMGLTAGMAVKDVAIDAASSVPPTAGSRICAPPPPKRQGRSGRPGDRPGGAGLGPGQGTGRTGKLDKIFLAAGFEWREPGCSMCLAMNADKLEPGQRSASNRNFEGRQGRGGADSPGRPGDGGGGGGHLTDVDPRLASAR